MGRNFHEHSSETEHGQLNHQKWDFLCSFFCQECCDSSSKAISSVAGSWPRSFMSGTAAHICLWLKVQSLFSKLTAPRLSSCVLRPAGSAHYECSSNYCHYFCFLPSIALPPDEVEGRSDVTSPAELRAQRRAKRLHFFLSV